MTSPGRPLVVCAIGIGPFAGDAAPLFAEAEAGVARAAAQGAGLAVLPELFALPYYASEAPARWRHVAETLDGPTVAWARGITRKHDLSLIYGMAFETGRERPANAALLTESNGVTAVLAIKMRLPPVQSRKAYGEADHFEPGPPRVAVRDVAGVRVAALVCYDRRFAKSWRLVAQAGADVVAVLVAGEAPDDPPGYFARELSACARSHGVHAVAATRYGVETRLGAAMRHDGETLALSRSGEILAQAGPERFATLRVEAPTFHHAIEESP